MRMLLSWSVFSGANVVLMAVPSPIVGTSPKSTCGVPTDGESCRIMPQSHRPPELPEGAGPGSGRTAIHSRL